MIKGLEDIGLWKWWSAGATTPTTATTTTTAPTATATATATAVSQPESAAGSMPASRRESSSSTSSRLRNKMKGLTPCCDMLSVTSSDFDSLKRSESKVLHPELPNGNVIVELVLGEGSSLGVVLTDSLMINKVRPQSPAEKAGLEGYLGYYIVSINDYDVYHINQITSALHTGGPFYRLVLRPAKQCAGGGDHCKRSATSAGGGDAHVIYHHSTPNTPIEFCDTSCGTPTSNLSGTSPKWRIPAEEYTSPRAGLPEFPILIS